MAGSADEARQLVDQRTVQLAKLHWALQSHSTRVEGAMRWLDAAERVVPPAEGHDQVVLPPVTADAGEHGRRLRVIVSELREVRVEVENRVPASTPEIETRYRLAS